MGVEGRVESLKEKVLRAERRGLKPFGWEAHRLQLLPPVHEQELEQFEALHGVDLPPEYRTFLGQIGRGGAGPGYGLISLENAFPIGIAAPAPPFLATPFPFGPAALPTPSPSESDEERNDRRLRELSGTLRVCDEGCGYLHFIVCSGPDRGQIWVDSTSDENVAYRRLNAGFLDWYERWVDDVLAGGSGCWWLQRAVDPEFRSALEQVKPWWRR